MMHRKEKEEVACFMRRVYERGLTSSSGGNISLKVEKFGVILVTPAKKDKGRLRANDIVEIDLDGNVLSKNSKPTSEISIHTLIYKKRPDLKAIIHCHPTFSTSFACLDCDIITNFTPESRIILGKVSKVKFAVPGTKSLGETIAESMSDSDVIVMENHGVLAGGKNLFEAFDKIEVLEEAAKITFITRLMGGGKILDTEALVEIDKLR